MKVEDGDAEVLRVEMKEGNGNFEGVMNGILLFLPIIEDDNGMLFQICWIVRNYLENPILQLWKLCRWWSMADIKSFKATLLSLLNANPVLS